MSGLSKVVLPALAVALLLSVPAQASILEAPTGLLALPSSDGVALFWQPPVSGTVQAYVVHRSAGGNETTFQVDGQTTEFLDGAAPAGLLTYTVTAIVDGEEGPASNPAVTASTGPAGAGDHGGEHESCPQRFRVGDLWALDVDVYWDCIYPPHNGYPRCIPLSDPFPFGPFRPECIFPIEP